MALEDEMARTYKHLFEEVVALPNLIAAYKKARRRKRMRDYVYAFDRRREENLVELRDALAGGTYVPGDYHNFYIYEPKKRLVSAAPFVDRIVHHAIVNVIEPIFERGFIDDTYACRRGKGTHRAFLGHNASITQTDAWPSKPRAPRLCSSAPLRFSPRCSRKGATPGP